MANNFDSVAHTYSLNIVQFSPTKCQKLVPTEQIADFVLLEARHGGHGGHDLLCHGLDLGAPSKDSCTPIVLESFPL